MTKMKSACFLLSGSNAFDVFRPEVFREKIREFPLSEVPAMRQDFTCVNFGWWYIWKPSEAVPTGVQRDHWEYGDMLAAANDCPMAVIMGLNWRTRGGKA